MKPSAGRQGAEAGGPVGSAARVAGIGAVAFVGVVAVLVAVLATTAPAGATAGPRSAAGARTVAVVVDTTTSTLPATTTAPSTTAPPTTTTSSSVPVTTSSRPARSTTTTVPATTTTTPPTTTSSKTPWPLIAVIIVLVAAIVLVALLMRSRRRKAVETEWRRALIPAVSDAGLARESLLSGNAASDDPELRAAVAVQVERAAAALDGAARKAPDAETGAMATSAAGALRGLAFAVEADRLLRHGTSAPTGIQLAQADEARRARGTELNAALARLSARIGSSPGAPSRP